MIRVELKEEKRDERDALILVEEEGSCEDKAQ